MNFKVSLISLIVLIGVFNVNASSPATLYIRQQAEDALQKQMLRSISEPMPRIDVSSCYPIFSKRLDELQKKLDEDIKLCKNEEIEKILEVSKAKQQTRDDITKSLKETCGRIDNCLEETENLNYFDCVHKSGDENIRTIWKASQDSSETAANMREEIHEAEYEYERCRSKAERVYVAEMTKANTEMIKCYTNGPSTDAPITDAPITDEPITDAPITDEPITDEPITDEPVTDAPITDAPITDAPITDAPITDEPITDAPATDAPITDAPITDEPITDAPATDAPITDAPITDEPITDAPATDAPITDAPQTDAPITPDSREQDQVEELEQDQDEEQTNVRRKLEEFMRSWGKRY